MREGGSALYLPVSYADHLGSNPRFLPTTAGYESGLPMPPTGEAEPESY